MAAQAVVPVVVARCHRAGSRGPFAGHVVIGVDGSAPSHAALEFGIQEAARQHRPVAAGHVTADRREDYWFDDQVLSAHLADAPVAVVKGLGG